MASSDPNNSGSTTPPADPDPEDVQADAAGATSSGDAVAILRRGIIERVERLAGTYRHSGQVDAGALGEVERLDHVLQAYQRARPRSKQWPWRVPLLAVFTAGLVSALLFVRVPCTEVTLDLTLSSLGFQLSDAQGGGTADGSISLTAEEIAAARVALKGIDTIGGVPGATAMTPDTDWQAFASTDGLLMGPLMLDSGTWVRLFQATAEGALPIRLKHEADPVAIELHLPPGTRVVPRSELANRLRELREAVTLELAANPQQLLEIEVTPLPQVKLDPAGVFGSELPIAGLDFEWGDPSAEGRQREFSAVREGFVYLEALAGEQHRLRQGEYLYIGQRGESAGAGGQAPWTTISNWLAPYFAACQALTTATANHDVAGTITAIAVTPKELTLQARAAVRTLGVGSRSNPRDLMPRALEWLQAHHETKLFWGVFSFLFLFVLLPMMRFWGMGK